MAKLIVYVVVMAVLAMLRHTMVADPSFCPTLDARTEMMPPLPKSETLAIITEPELVAVAALISRFERKKDSSCSGPRSISAFDSMTPAVVSIVMCPTFESCPTLFVTTCRLPPAGISGMLRLRAANAHLVPIGVGVLVCL